MTAYFRITVEDLETGDVQSMEVAEGDYMLIPFSPCHLTHTSRSANGTVQLTIKNHHPAGPMRDNTPAAVSYGDVPRVDS
jgi:hypothetical protein